MHSRVMGLGEILRGGKRMRFVGDCQRFSDTADALRGSSTGARQDLRDEGNNADDQ
jgi:hypothetical protein